MSRDAGDVKGARARLSIEAVALTVGRTVLAAVRQLDEERASLYADLVYYAFQGAAKAALEALMASGNYEYQSDFAKKYFAEGKAQGEALGKAQGKALGRAESILDLFEARGMVVSEEARSRILACTDPSLLHAWFKRALSAPSVTDIFDS